MLTKKGVFREESGARTEIAKGCLKKSPLVKGFVGTLSMNSGFEVRFSNDACWNKVLSFFWKGEPIGGIILNNFQGGEIYRGSHFCVTLPLFESAASIQREMKRVSVNCDEKFVEEGKVLGVAICSHYFDFIFTMNHA